MSTDFEDDISQSLAAECTGTVGVSDDAALDQPLPDRIASDVEAYDDHAAQTAPVQDADAQADADDDEGAQQPTRKVPLGALQAERTQRQLAQERTRALEQQNAQLLAQMNQVLFQQQQVAAQQQQEAIPDFDEDPKAYLDFKERQFAQQLQNIQQVREVEQSAVQVQQRAQQLTQFGVQAEIEFEQQCPDYREAYDLVDSHALAKIRQLYPQATEQQILGVQAVALFEFVDGCARSGKNPAQVVYEKAQLLGHKPGQRTPGARQSKPAPTSLSTVSGAGRAPDEMGKVSARDIAGMSNAEFDKLFDQMREAGTVRPAV
jgi:hypothetical protein